ncbi:hypothetical protein KVR01_001278 [Diaporthe batatas]|uniref:uncharacterized protein n=1 Tax=Diaporthe batatas TaxID=748121 RepID=UPI001D05BA7E|nr:uncharacterized protein KVR01_001278 [Diaporthe batatas]KAG8168529.1 hypothetical protein KVR01_001278 [Diaporthe batatas]
MATNMEDIVQKAAQARSFTHDGFIFLGIGIAVTLLRTWARWDQAGFKRFQADDYLVWLALILYGGETASNYLFVKFSQGLANNDMTDEERAALDPNSDEFSMRERGSKANFASWPQYALIMWSLKAAMCVYYLRLMERSKYRNRIFVGFGIIGITFFLVIIVIFVSCIPITKWWQINPDPGPLCYSVSSPAILWTFMASNIVTDLYIIWLPMPMLFKSTLPMATKIALATLFGCGIFVTIAGILRVTYIIYSPHDLHRISFWAVRETFVGIVTTNLPCIFVLVRRWLAPFFSFFRTGSFGSSGKTKLSRPKSVWAGQSQAAHGVTTHKSPAASVSAAGRGGQGFHMGRMGTFAMAEGNSSQERIVQDFPDEGEGGFGSRLGRKVSIKRMKSTKDRKPFEQGVEVEGIQKMVDITIVEERRPAASFDVADEEVGRTTRSFDFPEPCGESYDRR